MRTTPTSETVRRLAGQGHLVGGAWRTGDAGGVHAHRYAATGAVQAEVGLAGPGDVDDAVAAAREAAPGWAAWSPGRRAGVLHRLADLLDAHRSEAAELAALDNGTPVAVMDPGRFTAGWVRYYAGWADRLPGEVLDVRGHRVEVRPEPWGVVGVVPPWNGSMMGMGQKCGPALAAGNTVVVKPPEVAPFGMLRFAELALEAGVPAGVVNVVVGDGAAGAALAGHPGIDKLTFTGGTGTARSVMAAAAAHLTPLALELGGKSPTLVFPDADLDAAAELAALAGTALLSGQGCALPTRLYVHENVHDRVLDRVVDRVRALAVGDPLDPATLVGPVVTEASMTRILGVVDRAVDGGATVRAGGTRMGGGLADGWFVAPTVLADVDHGSEVAREEVFGPVLAVLRFGSEEEGVALANDSPYGLAAYVHTADAGRVARLTERLHAGTVVVNGMGAISPATPFGGVKQSGFGREGGRAGLEEMLRTKAVHLPRG